MSNPDFEAPSAFNDAYEAGFNDAYEAGKSMDDLHREVLEWKARTEGLSIKLATITYERDQCKSRSEKSDACAIYWIEQCKFWKAKANEAVEAEVATGDRCSVGGSDPRACAEAKSCETHAQQIHTR